jgi:hypothetical protein
MSNISSGIPSNKPALPAKQMENGGEFAGILQPENRIAFIAAPTNEATLITAVNAIRTGMIEKGLMLPS